MGSSHSKQAKPSHHNGGKSNRPPNEKKHILADSSTPLKEKTASFACLRKSSTDYQVSSFNTSDKSKYLGSSYSDSIPSVPASPLTPTFAPSSIKLPKRRSTRIDVDDIEGHSNVTRPAGPPLLRRMSELIDPEELTIDDHIRSPSGNLLAPEQFLLHPRRPPCIRERQEQIREKVRAVSRLERGTAKVAEGEDSVWPWVRKQKMTKKAKKQKCNFLCGCIRL